ncbi:type IX secretion system membrane protein PorP/SprF [bacterium]|nr:type IX secretion system membrane protein PorP/SprF [bacterium]
MSKTLGHFVIILFIICMLFSSVFSQDDIGARPLGMGRTFVAIADDGNAPLWNPAGMSFYNERVLTGMFSRLYWGVNNDAIGEGFLGYVHHFRRLGSAGVTVRQLFSNLRRDTYVTLSYSKALHPKFSLGVNGRLLRYEIVEGNIDYNPPYTDPTDIIDPRQDPLFLDNGWNKIGFTADVGMFYKINRNLTSGLEVSNLTEPNMTLAGVSNVGKAYPLTVRFGFAYRYQDFLIPSIDFRYINQELDGGNQFKPHIGVEWWFMNNLLAARTGYNPEEYSFGFTYRSKRGLDLQIDYAFIYPLSDLGTEVGATSHKLSASLRFLPPPLPLHDLALRSADMTVYPKNAILNEPVTITAIIENMGERKIDDYKVSLYYEDPELGWVLASSILDEKDIASGERKEVSWQWTPPGKGHYQVFAAVDDKGTLIPELDGEIDEFDEENNKGAVELDVFPFPKGTVKPRETVLNIETIQLVREEQPLVPIVFFEPGNTEIDPRFEPLLKTVADRLLENPKVEIDIFGYFNPESEGVGSDLFGARLAEDRAQAVRAALLKFAPSARGQIKIVDTDSYDPSLNRAGDSEEHAKVDPEDVPRAEAENRRVELRANVTDYASKEHTVYFDFNSDDFDPSTFNQLKEQAVEYKKIIENNPEVILLIEGFVTETENNKTKLAFDRALNFKQELGKVLGKDFTDKYFDKIFIKGNTDNLAEQGKVEVSVSGEGLVYRPMEGIMAAKQYEFEEQSNFLTVTSDVPAGVDSYKVSIIEPDGQVFKELAEGTGDIPTGIPWDWKDDNGNLIDPNQEYICKLEIKDKLGQRFTTYSDTLRAMVTKRMQQTETLIIVQFTFDEPVSESKFLESRIEYVARKFIEKAQQPKKKLVAVVGGHTDVIGMDRRNIELSKFRAEKEEENLRRYLIYLLGLKSNSDLNAWLKEHNTTLTSKGFSYDKPYIIDKWEDNQFKTLEIGDNTLPEGRTINRRVVIEFYLDKEGTGELEKIAP